MATADQLSQVKAHLRVDSAWTEEDVYISGLFDAAIAQVENETQHRFNVVEESLYLPKFQSIIELPISPAQLIVRIDYLDENGVGRELSADDYYFDNARAKSIIKPAFGKLFPAVLPGYDSVVVRYIVGVTVWPKPIVQAVFLLVGHWYANREAVVVGAATAKVPLAYSSLIQSYKVMY